MDKAATSWARAAISASGKVPSHILDFFLGSLISDTHFPQLRFLTPLYVGCFVPFPLLLFCFLLLHVVSLPSRWSAFLEPFLATHFVLLWTEEEEEEVEAAAAVVEVKQEEEED